MSPEEIKEFERSLERIVAIARDCGLDFYPMRYEICPADVLYSVGAYGMPTRFTHWSFGKAYHRMKTQYDFNLSRIYELVINSDPCYAFLLESNSLLQNKVIAAHVLAHSDFFKNNARFAHTSTDMVETMASNAERIANYEFQYGRREVESILDAALSLQYHVDPYLVRHPRPRPQGQGAKAKPANGGKRDVPNPYEELWALDERPLDPADNYAARERDDNRWAGDDDRSERNDLLLYLLSESRHLQDWERDILAIVRSEMLYFYPQLETKITNEGWATFWHAQIMRALDLSDAELLEFAAMHANVLAPNPMSINPYRLGYEIFADIDARLGRDAVFEVRECDDDASLLRNYLTPELVERLDLYLYRKVGDEWIIVDKDWKAVRDRLVAQAGAGSIPRIVVADGDYNGNGELLLKHCFEGEELDQYYVDRTLPYVHRLWGRPVHLETVCDGSPILVSFDGQIHRQKQE